MKKLICLIFFAATLISCQESTTSIEPEPVLGEEFEIEIGEQITIQKEGLSITFKELLDDSRCPKGVYCVWAGNAKVAIQVNDEKAKLNTHLEPKTVNISEYSVTLVSVNPYPEYKTKIREEEYVLTLVVTQAE
ncbi:MAG: hypothetical protein U5K69_18170 [Balneolaceae bacterium]|nr:hypothetical protein [Balneolaceae bacterium]